MVCVDRLAVNRARFEGFVVGRQEFETGVIKVEECFQGIFSAKNSLHVDAGLICVDPLTHSRCGEGDKDCG